MKRRSATKQTNSQRRSANRLRLFVVLALLDFLLIVGSLLMLPMALRSVDAETGKPSSWFGVKKITVVGNTRYDEAAIVGISGVLEGQSVFSVSERTAERYIAETFSYVKDVSVDVAMNREVTITLTEYQELGAVYADGSWMVISREGVGLMKMPVESDRPFRRLYLKGVKAESNEVGGQVLSGKDLETICTLVDAMQVNGLAGVGVIDLSDHSNIRLNWKNQIDIALGNDSNLDYEVAVAVSTLPKVLARHGETTTGLLNISQYSDEKIEAPVVIFTPSELLNDDKATSGDDTPVSGDDVPANPDAGNAPEG